MLIETVPTFFSFDILQDLSTAKVGYLYVHFIIKKNVLWF